MAIYIFCMQTFPGTKDCRQQFRFDISSICKQRCCSNFVNVEKIETHVLSKTFFLRMHSKQHCQFSPFTSKIGQNWLNWQCCLASSSKTATRILIFSIAKGANPSFQLKPIAIWAPTFFTHNNSFIATVVGPMFRYSLSHQPLQKIPYSCKFQQVLLFPKKCEKGLHVCTSKLTTLRYSFQQVMWLLRSFINKSTN